VQLCIGLSPAGTYLSLDSTYLPPSGALVFLGRTQIFAPTRNLKTPEDSAQSSNCMKNILNHISSIHTYPITHTNAKSLQLNTRHHLSNASLNPNVNPSCLCNIQSSRYHQQLQLSQLITS